VDTRYFMAAQQPDNYVSGGLASGRTLVQFPGMGGKAEGGLNLDSTSLLVWVITGTAIVIVLGVHFSFGGRRLL
jgi:hypothetical protein